MSKTFRACIRLKNSNEASPDKEEREYQIESFGYKIGQKLIRMHIKIVGFPNEDLVKWLFNIHHLRDGAIKLFSTKKTPDENVAFKKARCTELSLSYNIDRSNEMVTTLSIHTDCITTGNTEHQKE